MAFWRLCFVLLSVLVVFLEGGPLHKHKGKVTSEKYEITAAVYSGKPDPQWVITQDDMKSNANIRTIVRAIEWYGHKVGHDKKHAPKLAEVGGYKGFVIAHHVNGKSAHEWILPKCGLPNLEAALIDYTSGTALNGSMKTLITDTIKKCDAKQKKG